MNPYFPTESKKVLRMVRDAAARNFERDKIDHANGDGTPQEGGISMLLRTAIDAISCGLHRDTTDEVAEGLAMIVQAEYLARQLEAQLDIVVREKR